MVSVCQVDIVHLLFYLKYFGSKIGGVIISDVLINEQIRFKEVRVLGESGEQLGVMPIKEAQKLSNDAGVDLILIAPKAEPPVCRIMDYGKFKYEQSRRDKEAKKKQKVTEVKEIRLSPNIDTNDLNTKVNMARKFLTHGDKVKVTLRFKGRELAHVNTSKSILDDFAEALSDVAVIEKPAKFEGRSMIMFLTEKR
jgi:translation initiation factor IF-3